MARARLLHFYFIKLQVMHELLLLLPFVDEHEERTLIMLVAYSEIYILGARVPSPGVTPDSFLNNGFVDMF